MSLALYMDVHVPAAITEALRARGADVLTAQEDHMARAPDPALLDRATEVSRVLFTRDKHFLREGALRQRHGITFPGIVYAHQQAVGIGQCIADLELLALAGEPEDVLNQVLHLPLD